MDWDYHNIILTQSWVFTISGSKLSFAYLGVEVQFRLSRSAVSLISASKCSFAYLKVQFRLSRPRSWLLLISKVEKSLSHILSRVEFLLSWARSWVNIISSFVQSWKIAILKLKVGYLNKRKWILYNSHNEIINRAAGRRYNQIEVRICCHGSTQNILCEQLIVGQPLRHLRHQSPAAVSGSLWTTTGQGPDVILERTTR